MNPLFQAILSTLHGQKRECPRCRRTQVVSSSRRRDTVTCKNCGAAIPPPADPNR